MTMDVSSSFALQTDPKGKTVRLDLYPKKHTGQGTMSGVQLVHPHDRVVSWENQ